jgi:hypothetical protein
MINGFFKIYDVLVEFMGRSPWFTIPIGSYMFFLSWEAFNSNTQPACIRWECKLIVNLFENNPVIVNNVFGAISFLVGSYFFYMALNSLWPVIEKKEID